MQESVILNLIKNDSWRMHVLTLVRSLGLPDWWVGAGFVRNLVWDELHGYKARTPLTDIDVIYFDPEQINEDEEKILEKKLSGLDSSIPWSVKNQARMSIVRGDEAYKNASEGLSRWVETATCIGVRLENNDKLLLTATHGVVDLVSLHLRIGPAYASRREVMLERIEKKGWLKRWPKLRVV